MFGFADVFNSNVAFTVVLMLVFTILGVAFYVIKDIYRNNKK